MITTNYCTNYSCYFPTQFTGRFICDFKPGIRILNTEKREVIVTSNSTDCKQILGINDARKHCPRTSFQTFMFAMQGIYFYYFYLFFLCTCFW